MAVYVGDNHKCWDKHLTEFRLALNSAVHKSTGVTLAELNLGRALRGPADALLKPRDETPDSSS